MVWQLLRFGSSNPSWRSLLIWEGPLMQLSEWDSFFIIADVSLVSLRWFLLCLAMRVGTVHMVESCGWHLYAPSPLYLDPGGLQQGELAPSRINFPVSFLTFNLPRQYRLTRNSIRKIWKYMPLFSLVLGFDTAFLDCGRWCYQDHYLRLEYFRERLGMGDLQLCFIPTRHYWLFILLLYLGQKY